MKQQRHVALLIEDDPGMADEMRELLDLLGYECSHAVSREEAEGLIEEGKFCIALLDLEIKPRPKSILPTVEAGFKVLESVRRRYPRLNERDEHIMQIVVVSGHGSDHRHIREAMRLKADDFIRKPIRDANPGLGKTIKQALDNSGRSDHAQCEAITRKAMTSEIGAGTGEISIVITGREQEQCIEIEVGGRSVLLQPTSLVVLLKLVKARMAGDGWVHKDTLVANATDYKMTSNIKKQLTPYLPNKHPIFDNDRKGRYRLHESLVVKRFDFERLEANALATVRNIAAEIRRLPRS